MTRLGYPYSLNGITLPLSALEIRLTAVSAVPTPVDSARIPPNSPGAGLLVPFCRLTVQILREPIQRLFPDGAAFYPFLHRQK